MRAPAFASASIPNSSAVNIKPHDDLTCRTRRGRRLSAREPRMNARGWTCSWTPWFWLVVRPTAGKSP